MKIPSWVITIQNFLTSPLKIGSLEISPTAIKYLAIRGGAIVQASLRLPPGIIERGIIKDRALFLSALKNLHAQITPVATRPISVIVVIPSHLVFAQSFTVPMIANTNLAEAINLNLQTISPTNIEDSYYDYQEIKIHKDMGTIELLGAFGKKDVVSAYEQVIREAGFAPVSVEFPGLALTRLIRDRWGGIELEQDYLLLYVSSEGILMSIIKNGTLAFNHFTPWQEALGSAGAQPNDFTQVKEILKREVQRVANFHVGRTGKQVEEAILISPIFNYEIVKMVSEDLKLKIRNLSIPELPKLPPSWFPALGAALRGLVARSKDTDISLAAESSQLEYFHERTLSFIQVWRNILIGSCIIIIAALALLDTVIVTTERQLATRVSEAKNTEHGAESKRIQQEISSFNTALDKIERLQKNEIAWSSLLTDITKRAGDKILITKVDLHRIASNAGISGRGASDTEVLAFKEALRSNPLITAVDLPLSNISVEPDKSVTFNLSIAIKPYGPEQQKPVR